MVGLNGGGAFAVEVILTFLFVLVILAVTRDASNGAVAGLVIGLCLGLVYLVGIPLDGTSVNPARALAPALFVGGQALSQVWVFIVAPLAGGTLSAGGYRLLYGRTGAATPAKLAPPTAEPVPGA